MQCEQTLTHRNKSQGMGGMFIHSPNLSDEKNNILLSSIKCVEENRDDSLTIEDIISHSETLRFLKSNFHNDQFDKISISSFISQIIMDYELEFAGKGQQKMFKNIVKQRLTTTDENRLSLNALEISTRDNGLKSLIGEIIRQVVIGSETEDQISIDQQIAEELSVVKSMLDMKQVQIKNDELVILQLADDVQKQRLSLSDTLQKQYNIQMKMMEEQFAQRLAEVNKRFHVMDHQLKQKLKLVESKGQIITKRNQSSQGELEKSKAKIFSLEKQLDSQRQKNMDLEKKLKQEREFSQSVQTKAEKMSIRVLAVEKLLKEMQEKMVQEPSVLQLPSFMDESAKSKKKENQSENANESENLSQIDIKQQKGIKDQKDYKPKSSVVPVKPKSVVQQQSDEENLKIILQLVETLQNQMKTFKKILGIHNTISNSQLFGEVMYPQIGTVVPLLIEVIPVVMTKPIYFSSCHIICQLMIDVLLFGFMIKTKSDIHTVIPLQELENLKQRGKTNEQHVNEVMQGGNYRNFDVYINPQTSFWKKKLKPQNKIYQEQSKKSLKYQFQLLQSDEIQREVVQILKGFLQTSECQVKRKFLNESQTFEISSQTPQSNILQEKKLIITRCNVVCLILLLAYDQKDISVAIKNLIYDLRSGNEQITQCLKEYLIELSVSYLLMLKIQEDLKDFSVVSPVVELLLELCSQGGNSKLFLSQLTTYFSLLVQLLLSNSKENEFCEKVSIIVQRICHFSSSCCEQIGQQEIEKLMLKQSEVQNKPDLLLLYQNIGSIQDIWKSQLMNNQ